MNKATKLCIAMTLLLMFSVIDLSAQVNSQNVFPKDEDVLASAPIINTEGEKIGGVMIAGFSEDDMEGVLGLWTIIWGELEPGFHGFHIHSVGLCEHGLENPFTSAGGHFNLGNTTHSAHSGDLPSLYALSQGGTAMIFLTDAFTVEDLLDDDGSAFIIHAGRDNYANIPEHYGEADETTLNTGDAGGRIACGVVEMGMSSAFNE